jgi:hypothetical protein
MNAPASGAPRTLPADQVDALNGAVTEALDLAHQGRTAEGYALLVEGLVRAREAAAEPWAAERVGRWETAAERYAEPWGVGRG